MRWMPADCGKLRPLLLESLGPLKFHSCHPGLRAMMQPWLTATSASQVQAILLPQPPKSLSPRMEYGGAITAQYSLKSLGSRDLSFLVSRTAWTIGVHHYAWLIYLFVEMESFYVSQAGLKFLGSSDPRALASQSTGITGLSHCTWPCSL
ncbi:hypothetical protein AAY473_035479 [Plecturocebus cupreus]